MNIPGIIVRKREGGENSAEEMRALLKGLLEGSVPRYQVAAWLMAVLFRGMNRRETAALTHVMIDSGEVLDLSELPGRKVDKHSTGGVGDKVSIPLAPTVAAAGVYVPMVSGRGLAHTGGTLDKLESIPGLTTRLDAAAFRRVVREVGFAIVGADASLAPADARLYELRDVTGTVPSVPLITASILSKKYAAGVDALVLDVKVGSGAFMRDLEEARELARVLVEVSEEMGKKARAFVTSMDQPLGRAVGNALEVVESLEVLRGGGPPDVRELTLLLGAEMVRLAGLEERAEEARRLVERKLDSGEAFEKFQGWVEAQGGDPGAVEDPERRLPRAPVVHEVPSAGSGYVVSVETRDIGLAASALGAGRSRVGEEIDPAVGLVLHAKLGDRVEVGQPIGEVHARSRREAEEAGRRLVAAMKLAPSAPRPAPLVREGRTSS